MSETGYHRRDAEGQVPNAVTDLGLKAGETIMLPVKVGYPGSGMTQLIIGGTQTVQVSNRALAAALGHGSAAEGDDDFSARRQRFREHMRRFAEAHLDRPGGEILVRLEQRDQWPRFMGEYAALADPA